MMRYNKAMTDMNEYYKHNTYQKSKFQNIHYACIYLKFKNMQIKAISYLAVYSYP